MIRISGIVLSIILFSCVDNSNYKEVRYAPLFHDGNSKVWMLNKVLIGKENYAPKLPKDKDVLIFYQNGKCYFQALKNIGNTPGKKGEYSIYSKEKQLTLYFLNEKWEFVMKSIQDDKIILKPTKNSDLKYGLELIPLPELNF